jgi:LmbE family N-acetylglucosaminyl deacetylase
MEARDLVPIPDIPRCRRIMAFSPHPDDVEMGAGATIARLLDDGATVILVVASDGSAGTIDPALSRDALAALRHKEQERAWTILGGEDVRWLGFRDMTLDDEAHALTLSVFRAIRDWKPDLVFTPDPWLPYESHPDHRRLGLAVSQAAAQAPFPHIYPEAGPPADAPAVAFYGSAWPNTRLDVTATFQRKLDALAAHRSQYPPHLHQLFSFYARTLAEGYGAEAGVPLAEAFKVLHSLHLHFNVHAWER